MKKNGRYKYAYLLSGFLAAVFLSLAFVGCSNEEEPEKEQVALSFWTDKETIDLMNQLVTEFQNAHAKEADIKVTISDESELSCKETVLANPKGAADVYTFADDQFEALRMNGALLQITQDAGDIIKENGGGNNGAVLASQKDGKLFAYPVTASSYITILHIFHRTI